MKKIGLIMLLLISIMAMFAVEVSLTDGRQYKGDLISAQENRVVVQDNGVIIQIPAEKIKTVFEDGSDVTDKILGQASLGQATDLQYIEDDDFFVTETDLGTNPFVKVKIAKLINPATQSSKMQAQFMLTGDGTQLWTKYYYATKLGKIATIKPGQVVISFEGKNDEGYLAGPQSDDEKRNGTWVMSKVKDVSTIAQGYITLGGDYRVAVDNIRILVK